MYGYQVSHNAHSLWRSSEDLLSRASFSKEHTICFLPIGQRDFPEALHVPHVQHADDSCPPGRARSLHPYPDSRRRRR